MISYLETASFAAAPTLSEKSVLSPSASAPGGFPSTMSSSQSTPLSSREAEYKRSVKQCEELKEELADKDQELIDVKDELDGANRKLGAAGRKFEAVSRKHNREIANLEENFASRSSMAAASSSQPEHKKHDELSGKLDEVQRMHAQEVESLKTDFEKRLSEALALSSQADRDELVHLKEDRNKANALQGMMDTKRVSESIRPRPTFSDEAAVKPVEEESDNKVFFARKLAMKKARKAEEKAKQTGPVEEGREDWED